MRVLLPVYFHAALGGLQAHAQAQAPALARAGHDPVLLLPPGSFAQQAEDQGLEVQKTTYADSGEAVRSALAEGPYDLVHAHPSRAREVGLTVAREAGVPFALTLHGPYLDGLR